MQKIIKGDEVEILTGKDRGRKAKVDGVDAKKGRVLIGGVNLYKRHVRKYRDVEGGIIELPKPLNISNVGLICPSCKKVTRVGIKILDNAKMRVCKKCGKEIK